MKHIFLYGIGILLTIFSYGQELNFDWAIDQGGINYDIGRSIATDNNGNIYATGQFSGNSDFDPTIGVVSVISVGAEDIFVEKLDSNGNLIWVRQFGSPLGDRGLNITIDLDKNVYVTGYFQSSIDFDPGPGIDLLSSNGGLDFFILKLDSLGNHIWAKSIGGSGIEYGECLVTDKNGNVYFSAIVNSATDIDPGFGIYNFSGTGSALLKLDSLGNTMWVGSITGHALGIDLDSLNNIYYTGSYNGTRDFDPSAGFVNLTSVGGSDMFLLKLDSNSIFQWVKSIGGSDSDAGTSVSVDANGQIYLSGHFKSPIIDLDPGAPVLNYSVNGSFDISLQKFDTNGNLIWAKSIGGPGWDEPISITTDQDLNLYVTGTFEGPFVDFNPGSATFNLFNSGSSKDAFIQKLDPLGNFLWAGSIGGFDNDYGRSITLDSKSNVYVMGQFGQSVDFDPDLGISELVASGSSEIFLMKLSQCSSITSESLIISSCGSYLSPSGQYSYTSSGTYIDHLTNSFGCDSIITIYLTINSVDLSLTSASGTLVSNAISANYQWLNCLPPSPITGEIDSLFTPLSNGLYSAEITQNGCIDTTSCFLICNPVLSTISISECGQYISDNGTIYTESGTYVDTLIGSFGCDSILTLILTLDSVNTNVHSTTSTLTAEADSASYQWLNCSTDTAITGETDSIFIPTTNGIYSLEIFQNGCVDTSSCFTICNSTTEIIYETACPDFIMPSGDTTYTVGGIYIDSLTSIYGCDSIIVVNLNIDTVDINVLTVDSTTLISESSGSQYQWLDCENLHSQIIGATDSSFTSLLPGIYSVEITYDQCIDTSDCYSISPLDIVETQPSISKVYPNPTNGIINILIPDASEHTFCSIHNLIGEIIMFTEIVDNLTQINLVNLDKGVYFVTIVNGTDLTSRKIILN